MNPCHRTAYWLSGVRSEFGKLAAFVPTQLTVGVITDATFDVALTPVDDQML
jgi:hypothetical protein